MNDIQKYIESGILELYVLGLATDDEENEVYEMARKYPEIKMELELLQSEIEEWGHANAVEPPALVKPFVMASVDYLERLQNGERPQNPPRLTSHSTVEDFKPWLEREDMSLPKSAKNVYAKIIVHSPERTMAIVWAKDEIEAEVHHDEQESLLIVEGSCDVFIGEDVYHLTPGDFMSIPLHKKHSAQITSNVPCKIILERAAI